MRSMRMFLVGYVILLGGCLAALWKIGVLERVGSAWTAIGLAVAIGVGVMLAVSTGDAKTVEVDHKN